jgi:hypothetical protein
MPERIVKLTREVSLLSRNGVRDIHEVTRRTRILAINAMIEGARAGTVGKGFSVVAQEVGNVSQQIKDIASDMETKLSVRVQELDLHGHQLIRTIRGSRLIDLSTNLIDIVDRNLYERSCDVRWWATDAAVVEAAADPTAAKLAYAAERLAVILRSYTVYIDLWVINASGQVIAHGKGDRYPEALKTSVAGESWFRDAMNSRDGNEYSVHDISRPSVFGQTVATYAAAIREQGKATGRPIGVLGIFFDWQKQSQVAVDGVRISDEEKAFTRCMIVDAKHRIIASTGGRGVLEGTFPLKTDNATSGNYSNGQGHVVGFARTVGYETYPGLGWYGVIEQSLPAQSVS